MAHPIPATAQGGKEKQVSTLAERNAHIPTAEIEQDILDTEREIARMEREAEHLEQTPDSMREARWDHMRASARRSGIIERKEFIGYLKEILAERGASREKGDGK